MDSISPCFDENIINQIATKRSFRKIDRIYPSGQEDFKHQIVKKKLSKKMDSISPCLDENIINRIATKRSVRKIDRIYPSGQEDFKHQIVKKIVQKNGQHFPLLWQKFVRKKNRSIFQKNGQHFPLLWQKFKHHKSKKMEIDTKRSFRKIDRIYPSGQEDFKHQIVEKIFQKKWTAFPLALTKIS